MILKLSCIVDVSFGFESPVDYYDSQTVLRLTMEEREFESPVDYYDSQTTGFFLSVNSAFESPVDYYDSQTFRP